MQRMGKVYCGRGRNMSCCSVWWCLCGFDERSMYMFFVDAIDIDVYMFFVDAVDVDVDKKHNY